MLHQCWYTFYDADPTLIQHWENIHCILYLSRNLFKNDMIVMYYLESNQTRDIGPMLFEYWAIVCNAGPTSKQHWFNVSCLLGWYSKADVPHLPQSGQTLRADRRSDSWRWCTLVLLYSIHFNSQINVHIQTWYYYVQCICDTIFFNYALSMMLHKVTLKRNWFEYLYTASDDWRRHTPSKTWYILQMVIFCLYMYIICALHIELLTQHI